MFKSVFAKYITAFMLIIVISFTILAAIISSMMVNYTTESKRDVVYNAAYAVKQYLENDYGKRGGNDFPLYIENNLSGLQSSLSMFVRYTGNMQIIVTDSSGKVLVADESSGDLFDGGTVPYDIVTALSGGNYQQMTDLGGLLPGPYLVQGMIIRVNGFAVGTVFVCSSSAALDTLVQDMVQTIVMASLWVLLAALIAVYFISEKIIGPLKDMSRAAKSFASGKFDVRVPVTGHDEVAELAIAFNNMASALASLEDMRRTFLANVSHDLRTPMTTIGITIDNILSGAIPPDKYEFYLKNMSSEIHRLSRLVSTLLDISRIQAGERKFNKTVFNICEMARVILISFEQKIDEKKLDVEFECGEDNMYVYADRDAIYQILYNICDNGVKFSREGGKYRVKIVDHDKKVYVSVYNEGQGIKEEELPFVFDRFYKSDKSRGLDKSGVGLGLYIAKTIIDAHEEEIWVRSIYGEYCEFIFTLSRAHEAQIKKMESDKKQSQE